MSSLTKELENLKEKQQSLEERWQEERRKVNELGTLKEDIRNVEIEIQQCEQSFDLNRAAELRYKDLPDLQAKLAEIEALADVEEPNSCTPGMLKKEVTADDIAAIVSIGTGIPVNNLLKGDRERLLSMEEVLSERVIGQDQGERVRVI